MNSDFCVAVHAVVYLYHHPCICTSEELAKNICTHPARVRRIILKLKKANLIETINKGPNGGYRFNGDPTKVNLAMIAQALNITFIEPSWHSGNKDMVCIISSGMGEVMDNVFFKLDSSIINELKTITIDSIMNQLVKRRKDSYEKSN